MLKTHWKLWMVACWTAGSSVYRWPVTVDRPAHKHAEMVAIEEVVDDVIVVVADEDPATVDLVDHVADLVEVVVAEEEAAVVEAVVVLSPALVLVPRANHRVAVRSVR